MSRREREGEKSHSEVGLVDCASTLRDVVKATQEKLDDLIREKNRREQKIRYVIEGAAGDDPLGRVICERVSVATTLKPFQSDPWIKTAQESPL